MLAVLVLRVQPTSLYSESTSEAAQFPEASCAKLHSNCILNSSRLPNKTTMPFLDQISDLAGKFAPSKSSKFMAGGIGSGHGMVPIDDDVSDCVISELIPLYASGQQQLRRDVCFNYVIVKS